MEALQWNEVLATGIEEIDDQHKRLLEILNQLRTAAERRERRVGLYPPLPVSLGR